MAIDLKNLTIGKAHGSLLAGDFTAEELTKAYQEEIGRKNGELNAYLEVFNDATDSARAADRKITRVRAGQAAKDAIGPLTGIPLAIKDNMLIKGKIVSAASKTLDNYVAAYDATVIGKLRAEGAVFLGRTNMDEFAMGSSTENSAYGPTRNPHDHNRVAGGSSGGSAAAVGANLALGALGSDTGGSIRQPASFCGLVGLKPTYGTISRQGLIAMASSLDQIGSFGKTVEDAEIIFNAIAGADPMDSTCTGRIEIATVFKKKIGVPRSFVENGVNPEVLANFNDLLDKLKSDGYEIVDVDLSLLKYALACYYIIMPAEASSNLARFDGLRYGHLRAGDNLLGDYLKTRGEGFGREVRRRIMLGTYVLSAGYYDAYYAKATKVRTLIRQAYERAFAQVDIVLTPTAPSPAWRVGEKEGDPLKMYLEDVYTVPINVAGLPALSVPSGRTRDELSLGTQAIAPHFHENILFIIGKDIERLR